MQSTLSAKKQAEIRDQIARKSVDHGVPNPLVTFEDHDSYHDAAVRWRAELDEWADIFGAS